MSYRIELYRYYRLNLRTNLCVFVTYFHELRKLSEGSFLRGFHRMSKDLFAPEKVPYSSAFYKVVA